VNCGKGRDTARVDSFDRVRGCEQVRRQALTAQSRTSATIAANNAAR
jgi:hypothetical protein